ncbi:MAG: phosphotransferase enzyme family protein [Candidatus Limnocylindrales bacterium]
MRTEPDLDPNRLRAVLHDRYRLDVAQLTFVPYGIDSWSYVATCSDGRRAFVKLARRVPSTDAWAAEIPLMSALAAGLVNVPRPMADRDGGFLNAVAGYQVQVLEYLAGRNLEHEAAWPDDLYTRVAELVAAVHASTSAVRRLVERVEVYDLPFLPSLATTLTVLEADEVLPAGDDLTLARLRGMVVPRARDMRAAIGRLERLRDRARARQSDDVLCHTDIWGSNLLLSDDGSLHLVDWDGALIAPPEHDLFMFAGTTFFPPERFGRFLDRYEAAFRRVRLDAGTFGFYLYRRNLEDLAGSVGWIVEGRMEAMGPAGTLAVVADLLAEMPAIEGHIRRVREVLASRHRGVSA